MLKNVRFFRPRPAIKQKLLAKLLPKKYWLILLALIVTWSTVLGWGMAIAFDRTSKQELSIPSSYTKSVDPVSKNYQLGQELYLQNCSSCHIAIAPEVLPTEAWRKILQKPQQHYGTKLPDMVGPERLLIWNYLRNFSRALATEEPMPSYIEQSRYFKALHPLVKLPKPTTIQTCTTCHAGVAELNYRTLTPEGENSEQSTTRN